MKRIVIYFLVIKVILIATLILAYFFVPHNHTYYVNDFIYPFNEKFSLASVFKTWDGQHYLFLVDKGYGSAGSSQAFYPLFPFLIKIVSYIIPNTIIAGYVLVTTLSIGFIIYFYKFVRNVWDKDIAYISSIIAMTFPTAFYLSRIYTESLFLFLTALFFYLLSDKKYFYAGLVTLLIPMTRPVGIFILVPYFIWLLQSKHKKFFTISIPSFVEKVSFKVRYQYMYLLMPVLGFVAYLFLMRILTGDPFRGFTAQNDFATGTRFENLFAPNIFITSFYDLASLSFIPTGIMDRVFFVLFLITLPFIYKVLGKVWFAYSVMFGSVVLLGAFSSFHRYVYVIFPMYIVFAVILKNAKKEQLLMPICYVLLSFQVVLHLLHGLNYWVF